MDAFKKSNENLHPSTGNPIVFSQSESAINCICIVDKEIWTGSNEVITVLDTTTRKLKKQIQAHRGLVCSLIEVPKPSSSSPTPSSSQSSLPPNLLNFYSRMKDTSKSPSNVWSSGWDGVIKIYDTKEHNDYSCLTTLTTTEPFSGKQGQPVFVLKLVENRVWSATLRRIQFWDLLGNLVGGIELAYDNPPLCLVSTSNPISVLSSSNKYGNQVWLGVDNHIHVYPSTAEKLTKPFRYASGHTDRVRCMEVIGNTIWAGDYSGDIMIWSCESFELVHHIKSAHTDSVYCLVSVYKADRKEYEVWSAGKDKNIRVWDAESFVCLNVMNHAESIYSLVSAGNESVYSGSHSLLLWTPEKPMSHNIRLVTYNNNDKYVGEVIVDNDEVIRQGRGELHCASGEIYVGHWIRDKRHGYGVATYKNKDKYYGNWQFDARWGHGILACSDGTIFDGQWKNNKKKGFGTLTFPNGDKIEGEWLEETMMNAKYIKGTTKDLSRCAYELFKTHTDIIDKEICDKKPVPIIGNKWDSFSAATVAMVERRLKEKFKEMAINAKDISVLINDESHPLGQSMYEFSFAFNASYHPSYGDEKKQLINALDDIHSFTKGMENMLRQLAPGTRSSEIVPLVYNTLIPKIYTTIFSLYKTVNKTKDALLYVKVHSLSGISLPSIGIKAKFRLPGYSPENSNKSLDFDTKCHLPYGAAIAKLLQLPEAKTVGQKFRCIIDASNEIIRCIDEYYHPPKNSDDEITKESDLLALGAEDKFPIFLYCLLQANVPNLHSELSFLTEFAIPHLLKEEAQYRLIELEQAILYIESLDWNVYDPEGVIISVSHVEKILLDELKNARATFFITMKEFPRMLWLAEIFLMLGTRRDDKNSDFILDRKQYISYIQEPEYMKLATSVLLVVQIEVVKDKEDVRFVFKHTYPQYIYTRLASTIEQEIKHLI